MVSDFCRSPDIFALPGAWCPELLWTQAVGTFGLVGPNRDVPPESMRDDVTRRLPLAQPQAVALQHRVRGHQRLLHRVHVLRGPAARASARRGGARPPQPGQAQPRTVSKLRRSTLYSVPWHKQVIWLVQMIVRIR